MRHGPEFTTQNTGYRRCARLELFRPVGPGQKGGHCPSDNPVKLSMKVELEIPVLTLTEIFTLLSVLIALFRR